MCVLRNSPFETEHLFTPRKVAVSAAGVVWDALRSSSGAETLPVVRPTLLLPFHFSRLVRDVCPACFLRFFLPHPCRFLSFLHAFVVFSSLRLFLSFLFPSYFPSLESSLASVSFNVFLGTSISSTRLDPLRVARYATTEESTNQSVNQSMNQSGIVQHPFSFLACTRCCHDYMRPFGAVNYCTRSDGEILHRYYDSHLYGRSKI